jgi:uncharacterized protein involved in exopolysaccharide biosynthesis
MDDTENFAEKDVAKSTEGDDEISLIDLFAVLWHRKVMIIGITVLAAVAVLIYAIVSIKMPPDKSPLPNEYTSTANMLINDSSSSGGGLASALSSSGLGSLASMAGVSVGGGATYSSLATYLVTTNTLLDAVADKFDMLHYYKIESPDKKPPKSPKADMRKLLKKKLTANFDTDSGVLSVSFVDTDPVFAQKVVNYCVDYLSDWFDKLGIDKNKLQYKNLESNITSTYNDIQDLATQAFRLRQEYQNRATVNMLDYQIASQKLDTELQAKKQVYEQLKVQDELVKIQLDSESPVFQVIERPEVPDQKSGPSRGMLCIIVTAAAFFIAVFLAFIMNAVTNVRADKEAMAKFHAASRRQKRRN